MTRQRLRRLFLIMGSGVTCGAASAKYPQTPHLPEVGKPVPRPSTLQAKAGILPHRSCKLRYSSVFLIFLSLGRVPIQIPTARPVMAADPELASVLLYLRQNGFHAAESALCEELSVVKTPSNALPAPPPPVRITRSSFRLENLEANDSTLGSSDDFASVASASDRELVNPYAFWSSSQIVQEDYSSDGLSEFGTAHDYNDSCWWSEKDGMVPSFSCGDKRVTDDEMSARFGDSSGTCFPAGAHFAASSSVDNPLHPFISCNISLVNPKNISSYPQYDLGHSPLVDCCSGLQRHDGFGSGDIIDKNVANGQISMLNVATCECIERMSVGMKSMDAAQICECQSSCKDEPVKLAFQKQNVARKSCPRICVSMHEQIVMAPIPERELQTYVYSEVFSEVTNAQNSSLVNGAKNTENVSFKADVVDKGPLKISDIHIDKCGVASKMAGSIVLKSDGSETQCESPDEGSVKKRDEEWETPLDLQMHECHEEDFEIFNLRIVHRKNRTGFEVHKDLPIVLNTVIAGRYYVIEHLGFAAFSKVIQAHDLHTGTDVCLKIIKNGKNFFDQGLDEIKLLKFVNKCDPLDEHHVLRLYDYFYHQEHLFIVCEQLRANLYEFQRYNTESDGELYFTLPRLQNIARQCLEALEFLHELGVIHCDLKPENILVKSYSRCEIKVIDLGSSCFQSDNLCLYVQSRSYRAPEVILGLPYDSKIDIWSLGCILVELCAGEVLFPNESLVAILARMIGLFGPFDSEMLMNGREAYKYFTDDWDLYHIIEVSSQFYLEKLNLNSEKLGCYSTTC